MISFKKGPTKSEAYKQVPLGLDGDSKIKTIEAKFKSSLKKSLKKIRYSGIYSNFWLWNVIFLNLSIAIIFLSLILKYYTKLPEEIGITTGNITRYDTIIDKQLLYFPIFLHILIAVITLIFGIKTQKKLNNIFVIAFFNLFVLSIFEFLGMKNVIGYFIN